MMDIVKKHSNSEMDSWYVNPYRKDYKLNELVSIPGRCKRFFSNPQRLNQSFGSPRVLSP
jgi:hypothetical protein